MNIYKKNTDSFLKPLDGYGDLVVRTIPMPSDCNHGGTIFGGWLLSQIDVGASIAAIYHCGGRVATKCVKNVEFMNPIYASSLVDIYARINQVGRTSVILDVHVFATNDITKNELVATAQLVFVKISKDRFPIPISKNSED
jgi:acyl-CoA thioesterase YciA